MCISLTQVDSGYPNLLVGLSLLALGFSLFVPAVTDAIMGVLPRHEAGSGSAINQTTRQVGQALGVAVAGTLAAQGFRSALVHDSADLGLPASVVVQAKQSVADALRVADGLSGSVRDAFIDVVHHAFVQGIRVSVIVSAVVAFLGALFALVAVLAPAFVRQGLVGLGWSQAQADQAVTAVAETIDGPTPPVPVLLKQAIRLLGKTR